MIFFSKELRQQQLARKRLCVQHIFVLLDLPQNFICFISLLYRKVPLSICALVAGLLLLLAFYFFIFFSIYFWRTTRALYTLLQPLHSLNINSFWTEISTKIIMLILCFLCWKLLFLFEHIFWISEFFWQEQRTSLI